MRCLVWGIMKRNNKKKKRTKVVKLVLAIDIPNCKFLRSFSAMMKMTSPSNTSLKINKYFVFI